MTDVMGQPEISAVAVRTVSADDVAVALRVVVKEDTGLLLEDLVLGEILLPVSEDLALGSCHRGAPRSRRHALARGLLHGDELSSSEPTHNLRGLMMASRCAA